MAREFNIWLSQFRDSIANYGYYVNFEKVYSNINNIKIELNILNSLIGSNDIENDFENIVSKYPETLKCIPLLLAVRANDIFAMDIDGEFIYNFKKPNYSVEQYKVFMRKTGLMSGKGKSTFAPKQNATRAECAAILVRVVDATESCGYKLQFDKEDISKMGVFCTVYVKDIIVENKKEIADFVEFLNNTPIERAEFVGQTVGWDHSISVFDTKGKNVFTLYFTQSHFILNDCLYTVQEDYLKPIVDKVK